MNFFLFFKGIQMKITTISEQLLQFRVNQFVFNLGDLLTDHILMNQIVLIQEKIENMKIMTIMLAAIETLITVIGVQ